MLRRLLAIAVLISVPLGAGAQEANSANAKAVRAKLAYDRLPTETSLAGRLEILKQVEEALTSIVQKNPDSDLALKIVSGELVAGMNYDAVRLEEAQLQASVDTEDVLFFFSRDNGTRVLCWSHGRRICANTQPSASEPAIVIEDQTAGAVPLRYMSERGPFRFLRTFTVEPAVLAGYVLRQQPITVQAVQTTRNSAPGAVEQQPIPMRFEFQPPQSGDPSQPVLINGSPVPYATRNVTMTILDADPNHTFVKDGARVKSMPINQVILPTLALGTFAAEDLPLIRSGKMLVQKVDAFDALLVLMALSAPVDPPADVDQRLTCVLGAVKSFPPPPADVLSSILELARADDPVAAAKNIDQRMGAGTEAGKKLEALVQARWRPTMEQCGLPGPK